MTILALDPGPEKTGLVLWQPDPPRVLEHGWDINAAVVTVDLPAYAREAGITLAVEMIASYGMPVGHEVFDTCLWIGRFLDRWCTEGAGDGLLVYRRDVKLHLCGSARAKDGNIRTALQDRYGAPGTKAKPGLLYGLRSHEYAALAVAVYVADALQTRGAVQLQEEGQ